MSVSTQSTTIPGRPTTQPFQCPVCQCRFTRHENLKRHAALHTRSLDQASLSCEICYTTFSRPDLRHRHMKRKHLDNAEVTRKRIRQRAQQEENTPTQRSQTGSPPGEIDSLSPLEIDCRTWSSAPSSTEGEDSSINTTDAFSQQASMSNSSAIRCIMQNPTDLGSDLLLAASFLDHGNRFEAPVHPIDISQPASYNTNVSSFSFDHNISNSMLSIDLPPVKDNWSPSPAQSSWGCHLFFTHVSHFVPFLHQSTFNSTQIPNHLLLSMLCLAYQYGQDPDCGYQEGSGMSLSTRCFQQARFLTASDEVGTEASAYSVTIVQTYLLLQIYAMFYSCGDDSAYGLKTHSKMISLARSGGLMQPISVESIPTEDLESLWRHFIKAESHKRTVFAVHQIDTLWYQFLSIPRSLSHLEIKHDLPCPEDYWTASSSGEWAHRRLVAKSCSSWIRYTDAVRQFLSSDTDFSSIPAFDPYGAINITQFLVSSAREVSGWSTMTGMLSMDRLEPLRKSLLALGPFICSHSRIPTSKTPHATLCEATWETAMIEMQMWSPTHTGGIVEGSIDAVLHQMTYLAPSIEVVCDSDTAKSLQPHVDWFLRYLNTTVVPEYEAPWVTLYAYRAFMIAWQLIQGGILGAMQGVGVPNGDMEEALAWAKKTFRRRERWQLGKIILACLDTLEK